MPAAAADRNEAAPPETRAQLSFRSWLILMALVLLVRGGVTFVLSNELHRDPDGYAAIAQNLNRSLLFGREHDGQLFPTAFRPPLYPLLLAPLERMASPALGIGVLHVILGAITVWAVVCLALRWNLPSFGALVAAALVTLDPILLNQSAQVMTETLATCLAALALLALTVAVDSRSLLMAALAGACLGLCVLCRPTFLPWLGLILLMLPFVPSMSRPRAVAFALLLAAAAGAVMAPWGWRNARVFGKPIVTTTHGGYTLLLANNPNFYNYLVTEAWGSVWDAEFFNEWWHDQSEPPSDRLSRNPQVVELESDSLAYQQAFQFIVQQPGLFACSCLVRVGRLWGVMPHQLTADESPLRRAMRYAIGVCYAIELWLAATGLWFLGRKSLISPWLWGTLLLASFTAVHAFYWTDLRMRAPLVIVIALLAAWGGLTLARQNPPPRRAHTTT